MESFGLKKTFGGMVVTFMPNSGLGGRPGTPFMTIFGSYVGSHFPNIQYFDVCGGIWRYIKLFGGIWRYMEVYEGMWRYIRIYEPTFSTFFFSTLFGVRFSNFLGTPYIFIYRYMKVYKNIWTHFFDIVFFRLFGCPLFLNLGHRIGTI